MNLIFDIGGTLYDGNFAIMGGLDKVHLIFPDSPDTETLFCLYQSIYQECPIDHGDIILGEDFHLQLLFKKIGLDNYILFRKVYQEGVIDNLSLFPSVIDALFFCQQQKIPLYILSNGRQKNQEFKLEKFGIKDFFQKIYTSEKIGLMKPNSLVFRKILEQECLDPSTTIMIGNSIKEDILPAESMGIKTLLFNSSGKRVSAYASFTSYQQLPGILQNLIRS